MTNIIGFSTPNIKHRHCVIHPGVRLISKLDEADVLWCTECGTPYTISDTGIDDNIQARHGPNISTKVISTHKKKKYYDKQGNEITDPEIIQLAKEGKTIVHYSEHIETPTSAINTRNKTMANKTK